MRHNTTHYNTIQCSILIYLAADPLTRLTMEMVAHTLGPEDTEQLRIDFQVWKYVRVITYVRVRTCEYVRVYVYMDRCTHRRTCYAYSNSVCVA